MERRGKERKGKGSETHNIQLIAREIPALVRRGAGCVHLGCF